VYNRNLNGLANLKDILEVSKNDVADDEVKKGDLNLTRVDTLRIGYDLAGRNLINDGQLRFIKDKLDLDGDAGSFLHANQSLHVLRWLKENGAMTDQELQEKSSKLAVEGFDGL
jgi:hypothetical protein